MYLFEAQRSVHGRLSLFTVFLDYSLVHHGPMYNHGLLHYARLSFDLRVVLSGAI
jgi:hypothetical protein